MGGGGADSGQASSGGFLDRITGAIAGGFVGMADDAGAAVDGWTDKAKEKVSSRIGESLPGYGDLWAFGADGVEVTRAGKIVLGAMLAGLALLMMGGKR